jgi:hypothetical protein
MINYYYNNVFLNRRGNTEIRQTKSLENLLEKRKQKEKEDEEEEEMTVSDKLFSSMDLSGRDLILLESMIKR